VCNGFLFFFFFFLALLKLELRAYTLSRSTAPFLWWVFFGDRVSWTVCLGWLWTLTHLISASWVASITGVSHLRQDLCNVWIHIRQLDSQIYFSIQTVVLYVLNALVSHAGMFFLETALQLTRSIFLKVSYKNLKPYHEISILSVTLKSISQSILPFE
jgi:hypothetical protein